MIHVASRVSISHYAFFKSFPGPRKMPSCEKEPVQLVRLLLAALSRVTIAKLVPTKTP